MHGLRRYDLSPRCKRESKWGPYINLFVEGISMQRCGVALPLTMSSTNTTTAVDYSPIVEVYGT